MKYNIITISRQFGSGGHSIGKKVAEKLNIPYYDKELIKEVAAETGFDKSFIEEAGEYRNSIFDGAFRFGSQEMNGLSVSDFLYTVQYKVIKEIAEKGPCVIVGRCSDYILKDRDDVLNVFIQADKEYRAERIVRLYGQTETTPEKRLDEKDSKRAKNYQRYTGEKWGKMQNYDLCLSTSKIPEDVCVDMIVNLVKESA